MLSVRVGKRLCDPASWLPQATSFKPGTDCGMDLRSRWMGRDIVMKDNAEIRMQDEKLRRRSPPESRLCLFSHEFRMAKDTNERERTRTCYSMLTLSLDELDGGRRRRRRRLVSCPFDPPSASGVLFDNSASHSSPSFPIGYCSQSASNFRPSFLVSLLKRRHC